MPDRQSVIQPTGRVEEQNIAKVNVNNHQHKNGNTENIFREE